MRFAQLALLRLLLSLRFCCFCSVCPLAQFELCSDCALLSLRFDQFALYSVCTLLSLRFSQFVLCSVSALRLFFLKFAILVGFCSISAHQKEKRRKL